MKRQKLTWASCLVAGIVLAFVHTASAQNLSQLQVNLSTPKPEFALGEMVPLSVTLVNQSDFAISFPSRFDVKRGNIKIYIAYEHGAYKSYAGPQWGTSDVDEPTTALNPGQSLTTAANLLFNHAPAVTHLSPLYANREKQNKITSDVAFPQVGHYQVYAVLLNADAVPAANSSVLNLTIKAPQSPTEIALWNLIKSDPEYAYFLQTGKLRQPPQTAHSRLILTRLQSVVTANPTDPQAITLAASLKKYQEAQTPAGP